MTSLFLADFSVMDPSFGLLFWTTLVFILVWLFLGKFAFKPIAKALKAREESIEEALSEAKKAREEMAKLKSGHEALLKEAAEQRAQILKEAEAIKERKIEEGRVKGEELTARMIEEAKTEILNRQKEMEQNLFNELGKMSVTIAEQLMHEELKGKHEDFVLAKVQEFKHSRQAELN